MLGAKNIEPSMLRGDAGRVPIGCMLDYLKFYVLTAESVT